MKPAMRKGALTAGVALILAMGVLGGVWAWENVGPARVCERQQSTVFDFAGPGGDGDPTIEAALERFGRYPDIRGHLPPESLVPTDEDSPEFGAMVNPEFHTDTRGGRVYDIWKDGMVVQSVSIDRIPDGWRISGYEGCSPIP